MDIYLDSAATTKCNDQVILSMNQFLADHYGNASSPHKMGKIAQHAVNVARTKIANALCVSPTEVVFTSGATESNNIVIQGAFGYGETAPANAVFCPIDHKSTIEVSKELSRRGVEVRYVKVGRDGRVCLSSLEALIDDNTRLLSISYVNSEIGTFQDLDQISRLCESRQLILHIDAAQAFGKLKLEVENSRVDCISLSAHKIGGPKGVGALYVRKATQQRLRPLTFGGERNSLRSGTLPTQLIVGLGVACEMRGGADLESEWNHLTALRDLFLSGLSSAGVTYEVNSSLDVSVPHILNIGFQGVRAETLISSLDTICIASGSACNSESMEPSYVLKGIGMSDQSANCSVRISLHPDISRSQIEDAARIVANKVLQLQSLV
ncbi:cysteine desulfurase family protein [Pseudomonas sp. TH31]|uniref:cysteine desulfurase family protein n=1 Tax=Pseudomonas sp. TH31 TaxID=2796396 RepID=UPI0019126AAC|nr:cysteine desulfurase family protein [Pseudomonas sp. TH31]MBK5417677.1 cysteine desulfurase [Pseudomonas sp. TH31]